MSRNTGPRGAAMIVGFIMAIVLLAIAMAFATRMTSNQLRAESDIAGERAYELAQTANTLKIQTVWAAFKAKSADERIAWVGGEDLNGNGKLDKGEDSNHNGVLDPPHAPDFQDSDWVQTAGGSTCTRIKVLGVAKNKYAIVRFTSWARSKDDMRDFYVVRKIQRVVRFSLQTASIFDFAYFSTNNGTIDGEKVSIYGPVGANGNLTLTNKPLIDGKIFAAADPTTGALGVVEGDASFDTAANYQKSLTGNALLRPSNPVAPPEDKNKNGYLDPGEDSNNNGILDNFKYSLGYDGTQPVSTLQQAALMPTLGDLSVFKDYASSFVRPNRPDLGEPGGTSGGIVKQLTQPGLDPTNPANYTVLINQTYGDNGESGMYANPSGKSVTYTNEQNKIDPNPANGWKNGNLALVGTAEQPLVIMGPVVVDNDLVIKGTIAGQGAFYVGRNLHVVGDLTFKDPPQWKSNDVYFDATAAQNKTKDAVGFGVRGNIILGNYTDMDTNSDEWGTVKKMMTPPQTQPNLITNLLDLLLGYGNGSPGTTFNGDYTQIDGDKMYLDNGSVPNTPNRAYYQSTFSEAYIKSIATKPKTMQGIFYAGHFFGGRSDYLTLLGSMVSHDEGIVDDWAINIIYDARISQLEPTTYVNLFLPGNASLDVIYWKDVPADDAVPTSPDW